MKAEEVNKFKRILNELIQNSLDSTIEFIINKCNKLGNNPEEPDFIASLTLNFTSHLSNILKAVFPRNKFSITGVYCHQKPLVDISMSSDPELGDLLLVYVHKDSSGLTRFNSLLLQAKKTPNLNPKIHFSDIHQLTLYSKWPLFYYKRAGKLNGTSRDILPKTINDGAQYLLIHDRTKGRYFPLPNKFPMYCAIPNPILHVNNDFANELIDFLKFKAGRAFESKSPLLNDEWSKMIWDIIDVTYDKASKRKNAGLTNFPRQVTEKFDGCCFLSTETNSIFKNLNFESGNEKLQINDHDFVDDEFISPSIILIECEELIED